MKTTSILSTAALTLGAVGYLVVTEFPFWKKSDDKAASKVESSAQRDRDAERERRKQERQREREREQRAKARAAEEAEAARAAEAQAAVSRRVGTKIYRTNQICDCVAGPSVILETVEVNDQNTILTILNNQDPDVAIYPPGHEHAHFLLEWRYVNSSRPKHKLLAAEGISIYPETSRPRTFKLIFPRIADEATKIQLSGHMTGELGYFDFSSVKLEEEMPEREWRRFEDFKRCGFDGATAMAAEQSKGFAAHRHPGASNHRWTATGAATIVGSATGKQVTIRGERPGKAEVCLSMSRGGDSCRSCQDVEIEARGAAEQPDFVMKTCGGLPSNEPHWQFAVTRPAAGVTYRWSVGGREMMLRGTEKKQTLMMRPSPRPGTFEVTLHADHGSGKKASYTRRFHNIYSCPQPD